MTDKNLPVTGGCLCGAICYEADQPPFVVGYCHCRMCQKGLGNLFGTTTMFKLEHFRFVSEEPHWYESSDSARRGFCSNCGSPIAWQHKEADNIAIWLGTLDSPENYEPQGHYNTESKIPWVDIQAHLRDATDEGTSHQQGTYAKE